MLCARIERIALQFSKQISQQINASLPITVGHGGLGNTNLNMSALIRVAGVVTRANNTGSVKRADGEDRRQEKGGLDMPWSLHLRKFYRPNFT